MAKTKTIEHTPSEAEEPAQAPEPQLATRRQVAEIYDRSEPAASLPTRYNPGQLVAMAIQSGATVEVIEKLGDLAWKWQERQENARKRAAFDKAMALAQAEFGPIKKNKRVKFESKREGASGTDYMHETLKSVMDGVKPALNRNGIFIRFRTIQPPVSQGQTAQVHVTCILTHDAGHAEENSLQCAIDTSGNKNHIQAVQSAATYLERYTLKAACGIAADDDDDGIAAGHADPDRPATTPNLIKPEHLKQLRDKILKKGRKEEAIAKWAEVPTLEMLTEDDYADAMKFLDKVPDSQP